MEGKFLSKIFSISYFIFYQNELKFVIIQPTTIFFVDILSITIKYKLKNNY